MASSELTYFPSNTGWLIKMYKTRSKSRYCSKKHFAKVFVIAAIFHYNLAAPRIVINFQIFFCVISSISIRIDFILIHNEKKCHITILFLSLFTFALFVWLNKMQAIVWFSILVYRLRL